MPSARSPRRGPHRDSRRRTYNSTVVRTALAAEAAAFRAAAQALAGAPQALDAPTRLPGWDVRRLLAHSVRCLGSPAERLAAPAPPEPDIDATGYLLATATQAADIAATAADTAGALPAGDPTAVLDLLGEAADSLAAVLADGDGTRVLSTRFGAATLDDFLLTRVVETVVHADDLAAALAPVLPDGLPPGLPAGLPDAFPHDRTALGTAVRLLADALAVKAPGGAVEVRVPPFAVVQCVEGPRHTRGTPPNVVETSPLTWVRLATGRLAWSHAAEEFAVDASGDRSDLSAYLPVMS